MTIKYEYLGTELVESKNGLDHVFDDGSIRKSEYRGVWYEGKETFSTMEEAMRRRDVLLKMDKYRNVELVKE